MTLVASALAGRATAYDDAQIAPDTIDIVAGKDISQCRSNTQCGHILRKKWIPSTQINWGRMESFVTKSPSISVVVIFGNVFSGISIAITIVSLAICPTSGPPNLSRATQPRGCKN